MHSIDNVTYVIVFSTRGLASMLQTLLYTRGMHIAYRVQEASGEKKMLYSTTLYLCRISEISLLGPYKPS